MSARYPDHAGAPSVVSLREAILDLFESFRAALTTRLHLAAVEGRRAGVALAQVVALGALAAVLGITAWLFLVFGIAWGLTELGLAPWLALLLVIVANLAGIWFCWIALKRIAQRLLFPATMRHLHVGASANGGSNEAT